MNTDLHCIAYVSSARRELSHAQLEVLLRKARLNNSTHAITGILLYSGGNFLQVLEGPTHTVMPAYNRIRLSALHGDLIELSSQAVQARQFAGWSMAHVNVTWESLMRIQAAFHPDLDHATAIVLLKDYWSANRSGVRVRRARTPRPTPSTEQQRAPAWLSARGSSLTSP
jgi:hypothetical protein